MSNYVCRRRSARKLIGQAAQARRRGFQLILDWSSIIIWRLRPGRIESVTVKFGIAISAVPEHDGRITFGTSTGCLDPGPSTPTEPPGASD